jgi:5-methylcytosine-specific restriction endonuclease McrA
VNVAPRPPRTSITETPGAESSPSAPISPQPSRLNPAFVEWMLGWPERWTIPMPEKTCATCGLRLERKRFNGRLEDRAVFARRRHCSRRCGNTRPIVTLAALRKRAAKFRKAACEMCGATSGLHAHHKDGDETHNTAENIQTLCGSCHLKLHWRTTRRSARTASEPAETALCQSRPPMPGAGSGERSSEDEAA